MLCCLIYMQCLGFWCLRLLAFLLVTEVFLFFFVDYAVVGSPEKDVPSISSSLDFVASLLGWEV